MRIQLMYTERMWSAGSFLSSLCRPVTDTLRRLLITLCYDDVKQLSFVELQTSVAKEVFVGDRAKFEPSFQFLLKVNKELSDAMGLSLYSYPAPQKKNPVARNKTQSTERW